MGMFDWVNVGRELPCIECKTPIPARSWQTKELYRRLDEVPVQDVSHFYTMCDNCQAWNEYRRKKKKPVFSWFKSSFNPDEWTFIENDDPDDVPDISVQSKFHITESSSTIPEMSGDVVVKSDIIAPDISAQSELHITESFPSIPEYVLEEWEEYSMGSSVSSREHITSTLMYYLPQIIHAVRQTKREPHVET